MKKKIESLNLQFVSLFFFAIYFIGLFSPWFSVTGIKSIYGTLILSSLFPVGIISIILFIMFNIICIARSNKLYLHIINISLLILLIILSIRLLVNWGGFSKYLCLGFYFSNSSIFVSLIFYIANLFDLQKKTN